MIPLIMSGPVFMSYADQNWGLGYAKPTSKPVSMNVKHKLWRVRVISGNRNTKRCPRNILL